MPMFSGFIYNHFGFDHQPTKCSVLNKLINLKIVKDLAHIQLLIIYDDHFASFCEGNNFRSKKKNAFANSLDRLLN